MDIALTDIGGKLISYFSLKKEIEGKRKRIRKGYTTLRTEINKDILDIEIIEKGNEMLDISQCIRSKSKWI